MPTLWKELRKINNFPEYLDACWEAHLMPKSEKSPTVISTFAGAGGSSLGYSMAGYRELLAVEWDDNAIATFKSNFPEVPVYHGDIAKLGVEQVLNQCNLKSGQLDVFDGSPPCQGFSTAGRRMIDDPRNQLFKEYIRLLRGLQPKVFVMENVSGMVKGKMKLIFAEIMQELKASGYQVKASLLNAMWFGVPQSRERMIFIGVRNDLAIEPSHPKASTALINARQINSISLPVMPHSQRVKTIWGKLRTGESADQLPDSRGNGFTLIKVNPNKPCPTITKGWTAGTGLLHWEENRFLSIPECAQLGTFTTKFKFIGTPSDAIKRIGNSVPPVFMKAIAEHIRVNILNQIAGD
jgi:DNA (cytosine-5)-methyltransferase 1